MLRVIIYIVALLIPVAVGMTIAHTGFVDWLWYNGYEQEYYLLARLKEEESFKTFLGAWTLPVFVGVVFFYWSSTDSVDTISNQFMLLPLAYTPFSIAGTALLKFSFDPSWLYVHPLVIIPLGYLYLFPWVLLVWILKKIGLVT